MVPFGKAAFFPGRLVHTNEFLVLLGEGYYTERTCKQTLEILNRRKMSLDEHVQSFHAVISDLKAEAMFFKSTAHEAAEGFFDIIEKDSEQLTSETMCGSADFEGSSDKTATNATDDDEEYDRIMARLDELEREELAAESSDESDEDEDAKDVIGCSISQDYFNKSLKISEEHQPQVESKNFHNLAAKTAPSAAKLRINYHSDTEFKAITGSGDIKDQHMPRGTKNPAGATEVGPTGVPLQSSMKKKGTSLPENVTLQKKVSFSSPKPGEKAPAKTATEAPRTRPSTTMDFTGSIVEHTHGLQKNPSNLTSTSSQSTDSAPSKPVSRFKMQKGGR